MANRKAAETFILDFMDKILPGGENRALYEALFKDMSDRDFDKLMQDIKNGFVLPIIAPNLNDAKLDTTRNVKLAKELGHSFFENIVLTDSDTGETYTTPHKYMVVDMPVRRQSQLLDKKMSTPSNNNVVDELTGQATGISKGSALSFPELGVLLSLGLDGPIEELIKLRGGDEVAFNAMNRQILETGESDIDSIKALGSKVKSTETLSAILTGMHLRNNLSE
tara:strand:+ start:255 stop:923 length:669 start_codon:yes stop_codon:yes gene_type:complete